MKEIVAYEDRLRDLFTKAERFTDDVELQAHWARYLCVLVAGYIEVSVRCVLSNYAKSRSTSTILNFVDDQLERFQNPNTTKILQLMGRFDPNWQTALEGKIEGRLKDAVNSVLNNRNQIAHGQQVGITLGRLKAYYTDVQIVVQELRTMCA